MVTATVIAGIVLMPLVIGYLFGWRDVDPDADPGYYQSRGE